MAIFALICDWYDGGTDEEDEAEDAAAAEDATKSDRGISVMIIVKSSPVE
jgi:hypothetical protein